MSTLYHTPITTGAAANAANFNAPLGELDAAITTAVAQAQLAQDAVVNAGTAATLTDGAADAAQAEVTVDDSSVFVAGATVEYTLVGGVIETNTVASVDSGTQITLTNNIGTGGIADDSLIAVVPVTYANLKTRIFNALDYGAVGNGSTDDTAALQAAINAAKAATGSKACQAVLALRGKTYKVTSSLDFTDCDQLVIDGADATITSHATNKAALDLLGSCRCVIRNLRITGDSTNTPKVAISLGRSTDALGEDSGHHLIENVQIIGAFSIAGIYNVCSEINTIRHCWILPSGTGVKYGVFFANSNDESIGSDFVTRSATESAACMWLENMNIGCGDTATQYVPVYLSECGSVSLRDSYLYTYNSMPAVKAYGNIYGLTLDNILVEGAPGNIVHLASLSGGGTQKFIDIRGVTGNYATNLLKQDSGTTCYGLFVHGCGGVDAENESNIDLSGAVYEGHVAGWYTGTAGTVNLAAYYGGLFTLADHTATIGSYQSQIVYTKSASNNYVRHENIKIGDYDDTTLARVKKIMTATGSWTIGNVADGAMTNTYLFVTDVAVGDLCLASLDAAPDAGVVITAHAVAGAVYVTLVNHKGSQFDGGTRTLRVLVFKVD